MMKPILLALLTLGLAACVHQLQAPKEDARLKEAYRACITTGQGLRVPRSSSQGTGDPPKG